MKVCVGFHLLCVFVKLVAFSKSVDALLGLFWAPSKHFVRICQVLESPMNSDGLQNLGGDAQNPKYLGSGERKKVHLWVQPEKQLAVRRKARKDDKGCKAGQLPRLDGMQDNRAHDCNCRPAA